MNRLTLPLAGLEPDNLLAFLALLGTLRLLNRAQPTWNPRAYWHGSPLRPQLSVTSMASPDDVVAALLAGMAEIAPSYDFHGEDDLKFPPATARRYLEAARATDDSEILWSALTSDAAVKPDGEAIVAPPLCTMLGQGHQHMLRRLGQVTRSTPPVSANGKRGKNLDDPQYVRDALFAPWQRDDPTVAFRWDPAEDRRYALRDVDPSNDPARTQHGANRLAAFGLPLLTSFPTGRRGAAAVTTVGFSRGRDRRTRVTWPIWNLPWDVETIVDALRRRELSSDDPDLVPLREIGVVGAYRSYRLEVGYYANFSLAEAITLEADPALLP